jgi:hypothetical protein
MENKWKVLNLTNNEHRQIKSIYQIEKGLKPYQFSDDKENQGCLFQKVFIELNRDFS